VLLSIRSANGLDKAVRQRFERCRMLLWQMRRRKVLCRHGRGVWERCVCDDLFFSTSSSIFLISISDVHFDTSHMVNLYIHDSMSLGFLFFSLLYRVFSKETTATMNQPTNFALYPSAIHLSLRRNPKLLYQRLRWLSYGRHKQLSPVPRLFRLQLDRRYTEHWYRLRHLHDR